MIRRLRGLVREQTDQQILLDVNGVCYDVFVPSSVLRAIPDRLGPDNDLELVTFHYQQIDVSRGTPILIGFLNDIEREFFERFISVSGIGPKAALRAFAQPIPVIAQAIDEGDLALLKSLPGVGEQRAREIVAKLQGKVGKFALMHSREFAAGASASDANVRAGTRAVEEEAVAILVQLEYKKTEAKQMVRTALERNATVATAEELLNEVYRQQRVAAEPA